MGRIDINYNLFLSSMDKHKKRLNEWTYKDVASWLEYEGFSEYIELFTKKHKVDGKVLSLLTEDDLRQPPLSVKVLGDLKHLICAITNLQSAYMSASESTPISGMRKSNGSCSSPAWSELWASKAEASLSFEEVPTDDIIIAENLKPEVFKAVISLVYFFCVSLITSCVMVIVHDRVPDMNKYPPLPDIFLDNVPLIPWAFQLSEIAAFVLMVIMVTILIFHKHRFIIMRRFFALTGTVFLLRCVTMLITSLSVPGTHLQCVAQPNKDNWSKVLTAFKIWSNAGLSIQGVRTCGDYMYSGHTSMLTMLNFFITEYTPRKVYYLHTFTWMFNMFGIFFILAAHEHYSIDVFVAFYITSRLFLYYHTLANNRSLMCDAKRTSIWFPMLAYFECNVNGMVPNEFEWPFNWENVKSILSLVSLPNFIEDQIEYSLEKPKKKRKHKKNSKCNKL